MVHPLTYKGYRDKESRKAYLRQYMREHRARKAAERKKDKFLFSLVKLAPKLLRFKLDSDTIQTLEALVETEDWEKAYSFASFIFNRYHHEEEMERRTEEKAAAWDAAHGKEGDQLHKVVPKPDVSEPTQLPREVPIQTKRKRK